MDRHMRRERDLARRESDARTRILALRDEVGADLLRRQHQVRCQWSNGQRQSMGLGANIVQSPCIRTRKHTRTHSGILVTKKTTIAVSHSLP